MNESRHRFVEIQHRRVEELLAAERQELARQGGSPVTRLADFPHVVGRRVAWVEPLDDEVGETNDCSQQIVEVVGYAASQAADAFHLLRVPQLIFAVAQGTARVPVPHRVADRALEVRGQQVFFDVVGGSFTQRCLVQRPATVTGHKDERLVDPCRLGFVNQIDPCAVGQPMIEEIHIVLVGLDPFETCRRRVCDLDVALEVSVD